MKDLRVHVSPGIADKLIWKLQDGKLRSPDAQ